MIYYIILFIIYTELFSLSAQINNGITLTPMQKFFVFLFSPLLLALTIILNIVEMFKGN
jgi:hypothetical protein